MKVLYSLEKFENHYRKFDNNFYKLAKLSVELSSRLYPTKFVGTQDSLDNLNNNNIFFDEYEIIDTSIEYSDSIYSMPKIKAMMLQTEPFLSLDFDSILLNKFDSNFEFCFGFWEIYMHDNLRYEHIEYVYNSYINPFKTHIIDRFTEYELSMFNWSYYPNFSFFLCKNPIKLKNIYDDIFERIDTQTLKLLSTGLVEQFIPVQLLKIMGTEVENLYESTTPNDINIIKNKINNKRICFHLNKDDKEFPLIYNFFMDNFF